MMKIRMEGCSMNFIRYAIYERLNNYNYFVHKARVVQYASPMEASPYISFGEKLYTN